MHIISGGKLEYLTKLELYLKLDGRAPSGRKENLGLTVLVSSMKFNEAQNCPDRILVSFFQFEETLTENKRLNIILCIWYKIGRKLFWEIIWDIHINQKRFI